MQRDIPLCLLPGEVGVQYKNTDSLLRVKVHSVKNVINNYLSPLRPRQRFDPACLFVYGTSGAKQLMTTFITKSTGHSDLDWRKRTTWFTSDGHHNAILSDLDIQNFIIACTTLGTSGTHYARTMPDRPETTPSVISNPASTTQEQGVEMAFIGPPQHTRPSAWILRCTRTRSA